MKKLLITAAALSIASLAPLAAAQAGGATSAASRYDSRPLNVSLKQTREVARAQTADFRITEFSSSSARSSVAKR